MSDTTGSVGHAVIPLTGEVVALNAPTDQLADAIDRVRQIEAELRGAKRVVTDELLRRCDHEGRWTVHLPDWKITADGPGAVEYDGARLAEALAPLVEAGDISQAAMDAAVETVEMLKPRARGINALLKLGGRVTEAVLSAQTPSTRPRRVAISPVVR